MPYQTGKDKQGCWIKWGNKGTKHHYKCGNDKQRESAKDKANKDRKRIEYFKRKK